MLFVCGFDEAVPLLVDANDPEHARTMATEAASGVAPTSLVPIEPGVFVAELFTDDEEGNETIVNPLEHVVEHLERIDAVLYGEDDEVAEVCGEEAEFGDEIVTCRLAPSHDGQQHEGVTTEGEAVLW